MRKLVTKILSMVLSVVLLTGAVGMESLAAVIPAEETESIVVLDSEVYGFDRDSEAEPYVTTFRDASITFSFSSAGMKVSILTSMIGDAAYVGVKDISVQRKGFLGIWKTVAVSDGGRSDNVSSSICYFTYDGAEKGEVYRVKCTHYGYVDEYRELEAVSMEGKCSY